MRTVFTALFASLFLTTLPLYAGSMHQTKSQEELILKKIGPELRKLESKKQEEVVQRVKDSTAKITQLNNELNQTKKELHNFSFSSKSKHDILDNLASKMVTLRDEIQLELIDLENYLAEEIKYKPKYSKSRSCTFDYHADAN